MPRGFKLRRLPTEPSNHKHLRTFRLRIEVAETVNMTPYLFVHRRHPADPYDGSVVDEFCTVAGVLALADMPEGVPDPEVAFPFFRKKSMEVDVRSQQTAEECWEDLDKQLCCLVTALNTLEDLVLEETVICGDEDEESESEGESEFYFPPDIIASTLQL